MEQLIINYTPTTFEFNRIITSRDNTTFISTLTWAYTKYWLRSTNLS